MSLLFCRIDELEVAYAALREQLQGAVDVGTKYFQDLETLRNQAQALVSALYRLKRSWRGGNATQDECAWAVGELKELAALRAGLQGTP